METDRLAINRLIAEMDSLDMPLNEGGTVQHITPANMLLHYIAKGLVTEN